MACDYKLGYFEGTWTVKVGLRAGRTLALVKVGSQYELREGSSVLCGGLGLDNVAFTLKNENACLSLRKNCSHLFGIEDNGISYDVWAAERVLEGSEAETGLSPMKPHWRLGENWTVRAVSGGPPVDLESILKIMALEPPPENNYKLLEVVSADPETTELIDTLADNEPNRTLDGLGDFDRSVATWNRVAESKNLLFAMANVDQQTVERIRELGLDLEGVKEELRKLGGLLSFEVDMLAKSIALDSGNDPAVWGAEEGGG